MRRLALLLAVCVPPALAAQQPVTVKPVATPVAPAVVAVPGTATVTTPLYTAVYVPPDSANVDELRRELIETKKMVAALTRMQQEQLAELRAMRAAMAAPAQAPQPAAKAPARDDAYARALVVVQKRCANCHNNAAATAGKGGGLELVRGTELGQPDKDTTKALVEAVKNGTMPPPSGGKLDADEKKDLLLHYEK
jgi:mono/diheme cytochrome c family protein